MHISARQKEGGFRMNEREREGVYAHREDTLRVYKMVLKYAQTLGAAA